MTQRSHIAYLIAAAALLLTACTAGASVTATTPTAAATTSGGPTSSGGSGGASASTAASTPAAGNGSLAVGFILEPETLDFTTASGADIPQVVLTNVYETLVKLDQSGRIVPSLASAWTVSPDNRTYTFTLRSGVQFSDGAPFTADDAKFSFDRVKTAWAKTSIAAQMDVVDAVTVASPTELTVRLKQPSNSWLFDMTGRVGAVFSRTGVSDLAEHPIGTGPYLLTAHHRGDSIVLTRNPHYWGVAPALATVTFKYFKDGTAMDNALLTGDIQMISTELSPVGLAQFDDTSKYQIVSGATDGEVMMSMNDGRAPLTDVRVRQAITYALDKKAILQNAWAGYGTVIGSHESPNDPWFVDEAQKYPHDVTKAKALLAAAGQSKLTLTLTVPPADYATAAAPIIISELAEAGITVHASTVTFPVWLDQVFGKADYDLTIINHVEPRDIATIWGNPKYYTRYDNPKVQQLLEAGDAGNYDTYVADYRQVVQLLADDAAAAWLWSFPNLVVADRDVRGIPKNAVGEAFVVADLSLA